MRGLRRWIAVVMILCAPAAAAAQGAGGGREGVRDPGVSDRDTAGSALPRPRTGPVERRAHAQRAILVMLATLMTAVLILAVATIAQVVRDQRGRRR